MGPGGFGGPGGHGMFGADNSKYKEPKPERLSQWPSYLFNVIKGFFFRLFYIFTLIWDTNKLFMILMAFMSLFNGVMPAVGSVITKELLNALVNMLTEKNTEFSDFTSLLIIQFTYLFLNRFANLASNMITRITGEQVVNHIRLKISNKAKNVDMSSFDMPDFYERLENANREAGTRPISIMNASFTTVSNIISMISYIIILGAVSGFAPFLIIALSFPSAVINFNFRKKSFLYMRRNSKERRQMSYYSDMLVNKDMVKEIKILGLSDEFIGRYRKTFGKYFAGIKSLILKESAWHTLMSLVTLAGTCFLYGFIAFKILADQLTVGDYSLYTGALTAISSGVAGLISSSSTIYEGTLFIDNMIKFMDEKQTIRSIAKEARYPKRHVAHTIEFRNVYFRYPGTDKDVLKDISFTIEAGETMVLVGLNGAGKTTLIKLMTRLYDPTSGVILLDGIDIREYDVNALYDIFGILFQDFGKYAFSAAENIMIGDIKRGDDRENIEEAARLSGADEYITKLPRGYDTPLTRLFEENAIEPSIGQWQKLSIARAYFKDSDIMILDEPTASLDAIAEQEIFNKFDELRKDKTTIFVSHRLSSAVTASKIVVLENGSVCEIGNHVSLMALGQKYYTLFTTQAKRYRENPTSAPEEEQTDAERAGHFGKRKRHADSLVNIDNIDNFIKT